MNNGPEMVEMSEASRFKGIAVEALKNAGANEKNINALFGRSWKKAMPFLSTGFDNDVIRKAMLGFIDEYAKSVRREYNETIIIRGKYVVTNFSGEPRIRNEIIHAIGSNLDKPELVVRMLYHIVENSEKMLKLGKKQMDDKEFAAATDAVFRTMRGKNTCHFTDTVIDLVGIIAQAQGGKPQFHEMMKRLNEGIAKDSGDALLAIDMNLIAECMPPRQQ
jgi:hypothetical protein